MDLDLSYSNIGIHVYDYEITIKKKFLRQRGDEAALLSM